MMQDCGCEMINPPDNRKKRNMANSGYSKDPTYKIWIGVRTRSRSTTLGGRNFSYNHVKMSKSWSEEFENFLNDMGSRPSKQSSIDRVDNTRGYCKHNCRWATRYQQALNRRNVGTVSSVGPGVRKTKRGVFEARINILGRMFHVGTFSTEKEAKSEFKKYWDFIYPDRK